MITIRRIKIWFNMISGTSILHAPQPKGSFINIREIRGYYNDLTQKVIMDKEHIDCVEYIPTFLNDYNEKVKFPIEIVQYGLGCFDLYLKTNDTVFLKKAKFCADYIISIIDKDGGINTMFFVKGLKNTYSSMCQGETISLLSRIYSIGGDKIYYETANKVFKFLMNEKNELLRIDKNNLWFFEYPDKPVVLNGMIFTIFGLYDYFLLTNSVEAKNAFDFATKTIINNLNLFCYKTFWSYYDLGGNLASKFYHSLHISLMEALSDISKKDFSEYINNFKKGLDSFRLRTKMFWKKGFQKLRG